MRQILMIAYYFPPFGGAGVQRSLKFAKYLPEFGWLPVVLSAKPPVHHLRDETLLAEIPIGVQVQRVDTLHLPLGLPWRVRNLITRWVLMVDEQIGWLPYALPAARRLLKAQNIRVIFTTSAPYSAHLIGYWLKSKYNLTWIADFRDPWIDNFNYVFPTLLHRRFAKSLERRILSRADLVTVASESMRLTILDRYPQLSPDNVVTITNGFDPSDFEGNTPVAHDSTRFQITYTGSFYAKKLTPDDFLRCLRQLIDLGQVDPNRIQVNLIGNIGKYAKKTLAELGLSYVVHAPGYVNHRTSISYLLAADLLLLILPDGVGSQAILTAKLFEYLAAQKPILAIAPPGEAAELIARAGAGVVIPVGDRQRLSREIVNCYNQWERGKLRIASDTTTWQMYNRRTLTQKLALKLDDYLARQGR